MSMEVVSGSWRVKCKVSVLSLSVTFRILHPLAFLRKTSIPLCKLGTPNMLPVPGFDCIKFVLVKMMIYEYV